MRRSWMAAAAVSGCLVVALAGCTGGGTSPEPSDTASVQPSGSPDVSPSTSPSATPSPTPEPTTPSAEPEPSASASDTPSADPSAAKEEVQVAVTDLSWSDADNAVTARGFVEVIDSEGTCTLTLVKGDESVKASVAAAQNPSTMACGNLAISAGSLSTGTWLATLSYESEQYQGAAATEQIDVP